MSGRGAFVPCSRGRLVLASPDMRRTLTLGLCVALLGLARPLFAQSCSDLGGFIHANVRDCVTFTSKSPDGLVNIATQVDISIAGTQSFGLPILRYLPEATGNPGCPFEYGVAMTPAPGFRFLRWEVQGPITFRYIGQPGPPGWGCAVNRTVFRFKGPGTVYGVFERIATPPTPSPVTARFLGADGSDCIGRRGQELPNGVPDLHIRAQGVTKTIRQVIVAGQGADRWETPANGSLWGICVIRLGNVVDLYFEPSQSSKYQLTLAYTDNTSQVIPVQ